MTKARTGERRLHLFGLLSDGGVHSHQNHLYALLRMAKQNGVERVFVHSFMDGRDTLPTNGAGYIEQLQQKMREYGVGKIATVSGRYYAMDRDRRWEREKKAFDAMVDGDAEGGRYTDPVQGVKDSYNRDVTDEFIVPFVLTDERGEPVATIRDGDVCINFNFRADRARQITRCLCRNSHFTPQDGRELEGADDLDRIIPRDRVPKDLHLRLHDAIRQALHAARRLAAGVADQHPGERDGRPQHAQPARRRDREVRARDLLLQRRSREAVSRRRARAGAVAEGRDLRPEAGDVARRASPTPW